MAGFFLGGVADGIMGAQKQGLAERAQTEATGIASRGLTLQERKQSHIERLDVVTQVNKLIEDTMSGIGETIKGAVAVGRDPQAIMQKVTPWLDTAKALAAKTGVRDPASLDARVQAQLFQPTAVEAAKVSGEAEGTKAGTAQKTASKILGGEDAGGFIIDPAKRLEAANKLRDDYTARSKDYITIRDAKNRMDSLDFKANPGAADLALVFDYLKILDPNSTVREGEFKTAASIAGVPGVIESLRNKILGEGQLNESARKQILSQASKLYQAQALQHDKTTTQYANMAKRAGVNVKDVIVDFLPAGADKAKPDPLGIR